MSFTIREEWLTREQVIKRRNELDHKLRTLDYLEHEGVPLSRADLDDLASMGALTPQDRRLYKELSRMEFLLES